MNYPLLTTEKLGRTEYWLDCLCLLGLFLAALVLFGLNLDDWRVCLPGAFLAACSVPLLYSLGRELFGMRLPALFSALIYLTLFPVLQNGRLAASGGPLLCFAILTVGCALRSRRDLRWGLGMGIGWSLTTFSHSLAGLFLAAVIFCFLAWDTPRLFRAAYFWFGLGLGSFPFLAWQGWQWLSYLQPFTPTLGWGQQWGELLFLSWPWLLFSLVGLGLACQERAWGWAKLVLLWSGIFLVSPHLLLLYPALALAGGAALGDICQWPSRRPYPRTWSLILGGLALGAVAFGVGLWLEVPLGWLWLGKNNSTLMLVSGAIALTWGTAARLLVRRSLEFIPILFWGMYVSLFLWVI